MTSTRFWLDTEFTEDGPERPVDLISIGVVADDGREFHRVLTDFDRPRAEAHPFVSKHVLPLIDKVDRSLWKPRETVRDELVRFVGWDRTTPAQIWAWYAAYDHLCLAQLFGRMVDLPQPQFEMYTRDLKQEVDRIESWTGERIDLYSPEAGAHDALVDARVLRTRFHQVDAFAGERGVGRPQ